MFDPINVPIASITDPTLSAAGVSLDLLRLDLTDEVVSGNKWFKLKYNLEEALQQGASSVLSFGGAYSNHIHALAKAGFDLGIKTIGIIRGEPEYRNNPTLSDAERWGMELRFVSRKEYRLRSDRNYLLNLLNEYDDPYLVPEGGSNELAVKGAMEIVPDGLLRSRRPSQIILPCGTGGTLSGVALGCPDTAVLGIPVLKNASFLYDEIESLIQRVTEAPPSNWSLDLHGHFGGYGKVTSDLSFFMDRFETRHNLQLDPIYTGKMMMRIFQRVEQGEYDAGTHLLAIHTGGLQGRRGVIVHPNN